nr:hypothetical protein [Sinorhizobium meliloti]
MACNIGRARGFREKQSDRGGNARAETRPPLEIASKLYRDVEEGAQAFDRILSDMDEADVSHELLEAADTLAELWSQLSVASANKLRELQGLPPIMIREASHYARGSDSTRAGHQSEERKMTGWQI